MAPAWLLLAGVMLASATALWLLSVRLRDASIIDIAWGPLFVLPTWILLATRPGPVAPVQLLVALLVTVWGVRLAAHLAQRNLGAGEDPRYASWRRRGGSRWWLASYPRVFLLRAGIATLVAAPIVAAMSRPAPLGWLDAAALVLWLTGFAFELLADIQLTRFRADSSTRGRVLDSGVWRLTRHPNYFGDAAQWWALGLLALAPGTWWALAGPALMTLVFVRICAVILERQAAHTRPEYAGYAARTSALLPWPAAPRTTRIPEEP